MGSQGFRNIAGNPFVYQEDTRSAAFGLDAAAQKWKIAVSASAGSLPTDTAQFTIDPATNGDVTVDPNGSGNLVLTSGNVSVTAGHLLLPATNYGFSQGVFKIGTYKAVHMLGGNTNIWVGDEAANSRGTGFYQTCTYNTGVGYSALGEIWVNSSYNTAIGANSLAAIGNPSNSSAATGNTCVGYNTMGGSDGDANYNTCLGYNVLAGNPVTTDYSVMIGYNAGSSATGGQNQGSSCIYILNAGAAEQNKIRIGTQGTGNGQQDTCYIAGIYSSTVGATNGLVQIDNAHKLGSTNSPSITGTYTTTGGNLALPTSTSSVGQITINGNRFLHSIGSQYNTYVGHLAGNTANGGAYNTFFGEECALALTSVSGVNWEGKYNCGMGAQIMINATTAQFNTGVATNTLYSLTSGYFNSAFGPYTVAYRLTTGNYNTFLGISDVQIASDIRYWGAGYNYTGAESSNICIGNAVTTGESNVLRIGTTGSGTCQQNKAYIAGTYGVTPGGTINIALVDSNGQLGSTATLSPAYGGAMTWTEVTGTSQTAAVSNGYITNNAALVTVTLPSTAAVGQIVSIVGKGAGLWKLAQNSGQTIHFGSFDTTTGTGGSVAASVRYDCVEVICTTANTDWVVKSSVGALVIT